MTYRCTVSGCPVTNVDDDGMRPGARCPTCGGALERRIPGVANDADDSPTTIVVACTEVTSP